MNNEKLPCGCSRYKLCPTGERLWEAATAAMLEERGYAAACKVYFAHYTLTSTTKNTYSERLKKNQY